MKPAQGGGGLWAPKRTNPNKKKKIKRRARRERMNTFICAQAPYLGGGG